MKPKVVTFDCAETLVRVRWTPGGFAVDCAKAIGLEVTPEERTVYEGLVRRRWPEYREVNETRSPEMGDAFWLRLTEDWLSEIGRDSSLGPKMIASASELLYGADSVMFELFDDVLPTLEALDNQGIRLGVISNWDYSLHRVLRALGIHDRFEHMIASLEEGVEKPDARLFHLTLEKFGVGPSEAVHVGDNPLDDLRGAQGAGLRGLLIDRRHSESKSPILARLTDLMSMIGS